MFPLKNLARKGLNFVASNVPMGVKALLTNETIAGTGKTKIRDLFTNVD